MTVAGHDSISMVPQGCRQWPRPGLPLCCTALLLCFSALLAANAVLPCPLAGMQPNPQFLQDVQKAFPRADAQLVVVSDPVPSQTQSLPHSTVHDTWIEARAAFSDWRHMHAHTDKARAWKPSVGPGQPLV